MLKRCSECKRDLSEDHFYKRKHLNNVLFSKCKECCISEQKVRYALPESKQLRIEKRNKWKESVEYQDYRRKRNDYIKTKSSDPQYRLQRKNRTRWQRVFKKYHLTKEKFEEMLQRQNCRCAICRVILEPNKACIDHCHKTNKLRSILCNNCNATLGFSHENINVLRNTIKYLKNHS